MFRFKCFEYGALICNVHKNLFFLGLKCHTFNGMNTKRSYRIYYYFKLIRTCIRQYGPTLSQLISKFLYYLLRYVYFFFLNRSSCPYNLSDDVTLLCLLQNRMTRSRFAQTCAKER